MPVPGGFHVTTAAYERFVAENDLESGIRAALEKVDASKPDTLTKASEEIGALFLRADLTEEISGDISEAYADLAQDDPAVAVRSSATMEDLPGASFAGQQATSLNVRGEDELLGAVRRCWASLWSARAIAYRERQGFRHDLAAIAVVVQRLVPAEVSGILFTANPVSGARDEVVVNAALGLGEAVVGGLATPDSFILDRTTLAVRERQTVGADVAAPDQLYSRDRRGGDRAAEPHAGHPYPASLRPAVPVRPYLRILHTSPCWSWTHPAPSTGAVQEVSWTLEPASFPPVAGTKHPTNTRGRPPHDPSRKLQNAKGYTVVLAGSCHFLL